MVAQNDGIDVEWSIMVVLEKLLYFLGRLAKALGRAHMRAWNGLSILVVPEESALGPSKHAINYYILLFFGALVICIPVAALGMFVERRFRRTNPAEIIQNRIVLLNTLSRLSLEKQELLLLAERQMQQYQKLSTRRPDKFLRAFTNEKVALMSVKRKAEPGLTRGTQNLARIRKIRKQARNVRDASYFTLNLFWNRMSLHHMMPRNRPLPQGIGQISSVYGPRKNPFAIGIGGGEFHRGYDLAAPHGTPIHSTAPGVVIKVVDKDRGEGYGRFILIHHGLGYTSLYAHCYEVLVEEGERVKRGQLIARVGRSGRTTGSHVHYEIGLGISPRSINPWYFMKLD